MTSAACGLYYLAEVVEEYTHVVKRAIYVTCFAVLASHVAFAMSEPQLPKAGLAAGFTNHLCYLWLHGDYPQLRFASPQFVLSAVLLVLSHYLMLSHFLNHYHTLTHVLAFFFFNTWLVPFGFFVSLSVNESVLPDRQAQSAEQMHVAGGERTRQKSGIVTAFTFLGKQRDEIVPSMAKKV